jgi:hypothetical protein
MDRVYIKGGSYAMDEFKKAIYLYPNFVNGMVELKNGQKILRPVNYNRIAATIEFINDGKDTLAIADESAVNQVIVGDDVFIFSPACLRAISKGKAKLYIHEKMKVGDVQNIGAFGIPNSGSGITKNEQVNMNYQNFNFEVDETIIISKATYFLIETENHEFIPANKKNVLKAYPNKKDAINDYLKSNNVNFNKQAQLQALAEYISGL